MIGVIIGLLFLCCCMSSLSSIGGAVSSDKSSSKVTTSEPPMSQQCKDLTNFIELQEEFYKKFDALSDVIEKRRIRGEFLQKMMPLMSELSQKYPTDPKNPDEIFDGCPISLKNRAYNTKKRARDIMTV